MAENFFNQFLPNFAGTIFGGIFLTIIFFIFKEKLFSPPMIAGIWECETTTQETKYNPYRGMKICYTITLLQSGTIISGMGEKVRESAAAGDRQYDGKHRRTADISGGITKRFFGSDEIVIFWREDGEQREFASFFRLRVSGCKRTGNLCGTFQTTAAQSSGTTLWTRIA